MANTKQNKEPTATGRPKIFKSPQEIEDKVAKYKEYLADKDKPPTMAGLAYFLEIDRKTLFNYSKDDLFFPTIKRFRDWVLMELEEMCIDKGNGGTVFIAKNYGYTDKQELEHSGSLGVTIVDDIGIEDVNED